MRADVEDGLPCRPRRRSSGDARGARHGARAALVPGRAAVPVRARAGRARARRTALFGEWEDAASRIEHNHAVVGCFTVPGGGTVFNAGCTDWTYGIEGGDPAVQRVTRNVLERLSR